MSAPRLSEPQLVALAARTHHSVPSAYNTWLFFKRNVLENDERRRAFLLAPKSKTTTETAIAAAAPEEKEEEEDNGEESNLMTLKEFRFERCEPTVQVAARVLRVLRRSETRRRR